MIVPPKGYRKNAGAQPTAKASQAQDTVDTKLVSQKTMANGATELTYQRSIAMNGNVVNRYNPVNKLGYQWYYSSDNSPYSINAMQIPTDPHQIMALSTNLYFSDELIHTVVNLMVDFSIGGFDNQTEDKEVKAFYDEWCDEVNMSQVLKWIFLEYYRTGNVPIYRDMDKEGIPSAYTVLDPLQVQVIGSLMFGQERLAIQVSDDLKELVNDPTLSQFSVKLPDTILKGIRGGGNMVLLDEKSADRITYKRQPYERYAIPFTHAVFWPALFKQKLRQMDLSTTEGIINQLIIVKVGSDEFPATPEQIEAVTELMATPSKSYTLVWNHAIDIEFKAPAGIDTLANDKYRQVDQDILAGLGITRVLVDGQSANFSTAWVSILSLIERLEWGRADVISWLTREYKKIAKIKGFKAPPKPKLNKMNLREDTFVKNVLMSLYDRGVLSAQTLLDELNFNLDVEVERRKDEKKLGDLVLPPTLPFSGPGGGGKPGGGTPSGRPDGKGRPSGAPTNNYQKRSIKSEPRGMNGPKAKGSNDDEEAPHDMALALADSKTWLAYHYHMQQSWEKAHDSIAKAKEEEDHKKRNDDLIMFIVMLCDDMRSLSDDYLSVAFDDSYKQWHNSMPHYVHGMKAKVLKWHKDKIDGFEKSLRSGIVSASQVGDDVTSVLDDYYIRFGMYPTEGVVIADRFGNVAGMRAVGYNSGRWVAQMDDNTCPVCASLHNTVFNLDEDDIPLTHPNCRCELVPE